MRLVTTFTPTYFNSSFHFILFNTLWDFFYFFYFFVFFHVFSMSLFAFSRNVLIMTFLYSFTNILILISFYLFILSCMYFFLFSFFSSYIFSILVTCSFMNTFYFCLSSSGIFWYWFLL